MMLTIMGIRQLRVITARDLGYQPLTVDLSTQAIFNMNNVFLWLHICEPFDGIKKKNFTFEHMNIFLLFYFFNFFPYNCKRKQLLSKWSVPPKYKGNLTGDMPKDLKCTNIMISSQYFEMRMFFYWGCFNRWMVDIYIGAKKSCHTDRYCNC